ncbi:MAG: hypothetical protein EOM01_07660 [Spirochaetia bacterium]|jgi:hypothetical protein|nr:hypothetical protein [Spirochaetia bacterium]
MILTISRTKTITPKALGNNKAKEPSTVTFRIPTSEETEKFLAEKTPDNKMFTQFVESMTFTDEAGEPFKPADFPKLPGVYALVSEVANEIVKAGMLGTETKNG